MLDDQNNSSENYEKITPTKADTRSMKWQQSWWHYLNIDTIDVH